MIRPPLVKCEQKEFPELWSFRGFLGLPKTRLKLQIDHKMTVTMGISEMICDVLTERNRLTTVALNEVVIGLNESNFGRGNWS